MKRRPPEEREGILVKFEVTPMLAEAIRMARIQSHLASKDLAAHLNKSPAYISKLERGEVRTIEEAELTSILNFVLPERKTLPDKLEALADSLSLRHTPLEISKQLWFENYDWVICKRTVPPALRRDIKEKLDAGQASIRAFCLLVNANTELPEHIRNDQNIPCNQWLEALPADDPGNYIIKHKIYPSEIRRFLAADGEVEANYLFVFVLVRFLYWMIDFPGRDVLTKAEHQSIVRKTVEFLNEHEFFSASGKARLKQDGKMKEKLGFLLSANQPGDGLLIQELASLAETMGRLDAERAGKSLKGMNINLEWDPAFMLKLVSLPFYDLESMSFTNKKQLLTEMEGLLQTYKDMPATQKSLESYD